MFRLYSLLYSLAFIAMLPVFLLNREKYLQGLSERFGRLPEFRKDERPVIWVHCVSVGEANAARPLIKSLREEYPGYRIVISTVTKTGQDLCRKLYSEDAELIFYFPFDWKFSVSRALRAIRPNLVLVLETEIWFNFFRESRKRGITLAIVNGRVSDKSARRYSRIPKTIGRVLHYPNLVLAQSERDAERFHELGVKSRKIVVTGNLKFDQDPASGDKKKTAYFRERFSVDGASPVIVAASTHSPEEKWLLQALGELRGTEDGARTRLFIAPRHPERFDEVAETIEESGFSFARRTEALDLSDGEVPVVLLDSIGELRSAYPLADVVFTGGSLIPHGGQNVLEPAMEAKAVVTGPYMMNFRAIAEEFERERAFVQLDQLPDEEIPGALARAFQELIADREERDEIGRRALAIVQKNRGAAERTLEALRPSLEVNRKRTPETSEAPSK